MYVVLMDFDLEEFEPWNETAIATKETIVKAGKADEFSVMINDLYPDGIREVTINDMLWFDWKWCYNQLGIKEDSEASSYDIADALSKKTNKETVSF